MRAFSNGRSVFLGFVVGLIYTAVLTVGCATTNTNKSGASDSTQTQKNKQITLVQMSETAQEVHVLVTGDQNLTFTAVKQPDPPVVVFYFPNTVAPAKKSVDTGAGNFITGIDLTELTETGHTVRLEIKTRSDAPYTVDRQGNALDITFQKLSANSKKATSETPIEESNTDTKSTGTASTVGANSVSGTILETIEPKSLPDGTQIEIRRSGSVIYFV